jgi:hypothetical protein
VGGFAGHAKVSVGDEKKRPEATVGRPGGLVKTE